MLVAWICARSLALIAPVLPRWPDAPVVEPEPEVPPEPVVPEVVPDPVVADPVVPDPVVPDPVVPDPVVPDPVVPGMLEPDMLVPLMLDEPAVPPDKRPTISTWWPICFRNSESDRPRT